MRIQPELRLPSEPGALNRQLTDAWRSMATQANQLSEGQINAITNAATAAPTGSAVTYNQGDVIRNKTPSELGTAGSKYVIWGWQCLVAGAPGTWVQLRFLTGN